MTETPGRSFRFSKLRSCRVRCRSNARDLRALFADDTHGLSVIAEARPDSRHAVGVAHACGNAGFGSEKKTGLCHHDRHAVENPSLPGAAARSDPDRTAEKEGLPFQTKLLEPTIEDSFW